MEPQDLDEHQGLTPQMVREWAESHGYTYRTSGLVAGGYVSFANPLRPDALLWLIPLLADRAHRSVQSLLREINPRMRKGFPSGEALSRHDRWIAAKPDGIVVMCRWRPPYMVNAAGGGDFALPEQCKQWTFWPCDEHGNKVKWPTDAQGDML